MPGPKPRNLTGRVFGKWTVLRFTRRDRVHRYYLCQCQCGTELEIRADKLKGGRTRQCAKCYGNRKYDRFMRLTRDLEAGKRYGDWTLIKIMGINAKHGTMALVRCTCGKEAARSLRELDKGCTQRCRKCAAKVRTRSLMTERSARGARYRKWYNSKYKKGLR